MQRFSTAVALCLALLPALAGAGNQPTWDKAIANPAARFKPALGGAAYLDKETGLVWEAAPAQAVYRTFAQAQAACAAAVIGGRGGWRVPTVEELTSFAVPAPGAPFNYTSDYYWSATTVAGTTTSGFILNLSGGNTLALAKNNSELVWCVRGGRGYDGQ